MLAKPDLPRHMAHRESGGRLRSPTWSGPEGSSHNELRRVARLLFEKAVFGPPFSFLRLSQIREAFILSRAALRLPVAGTSPATLPRPKGGMLA